MAFKKTSGPPLMKEIREHQIPKQIPEQLQLLVGNIKSATEFRECKFVDPFPGPIITQNSWTVKLSEHNL